MVTLFLGNATTRIGGCLDKAVLEKLDKAMSFWVEGAFFSEMFQPIWCSICHSKTEPILSGKALFTNTRIFAGGVKSTIRSCRIHGEIPTIKLWDGKKHLLSMAKLSFPTGLFGYAREVLNKAGVPYVVEDCRVKPVLGKPIELRGVTLYDYQRNTVDCAILKQRGIVQAPTGSGKTEIFAGIIGRLNIPTVVYVSRTTLMHQTKERLERRLGVEVGEVGEGKCDIKKFTVAMIQTTFVSAKKEVMDLLKNTQLMIMDECHHLPSESAYRVHKMSEKSFYRFGFSATPWRDAGDDIMLEAACAKKFIHIKAKALFDRGILSVPYIFFIKCPTVEGNDAKLSYPKLYTKCVVDNKYRNSLGCYVANHLNKQGKSVLIAVTRIEHGYKVLELLKEKYPHLRSCFAQGETETVQKKRIISDLNKGELDVVVATNIMGEGVDIPNLGALINLKAQSSSVDTFQLVGRVMRATASKKKCIVVDFMDEGKYLEDHAKSRVKILKSEDGYKVKILEGQDQIGEIVDED